MRGPKDRASCRLVALAAQATRWILDDQARLKFMLRRGRDFLLGGVFDDVLLRDGCILIDVQYCLKSHR